MKVRVLAARALLVAGSAGVLGVSAPASASTITLGVSANNSIQIQALTISNQTVYEIQLGGGNNQPPNNTFVTGAASTQIGSTLYSGFYRLSTQSSAQLQMVNTIVGPTPGSNDEYDFLTGRDMLLLTFAQTSNFSNPWLVADITNVYATQEVQTNGNAHPPIFLIGSMGSPTGGSLAASFSGGGSEIRLDIGGNQRLLSLLPPNSYSGLRVEGGVITQQTAVPIPAAVWLLGSALVGLGLLKRRLPTITH